MKKFLFDLFPVILFVAIFLWGDNNPEQASVFATQYLSGLVSGGQITAKLAPVLLATAVAVLASVLQIGYLLIARKKIDGMLWVGFVIICVAGGATIYFQNEAFIKWKPTVLYWIFGGVLLCSELIFKKNLMRSAMGKQITLPDPVWFRLNMMWIAFFIALGIINLFVAYNFSTATWAKFKLFGVMGLIFVFALAQSAYLAKYIEAEDAP